MSFSIAPSSSIDRREIVRRTHARRVLVVGQVQGVGFRPFVYRLATELRLAGQVANCTAGVEILIAGPSERLDSFLHRLQTELPPLARITEVTIESVRPIDDSVFVISESVTDISIRARLPRDIRLCQICADEIECCSNRRRGYAFTACTACGPRYSVMESLPYDRSRTTLNDFPLCQPCETEFASPSDRRFHAQAIVCGDCGPQVEFRDPSGRNIAARAAAIQMAKEQLVDGKIVALKGLGGYQLLVRADDSAAVARLRHRKPRPTKPLAVMIRDISTAEHVARLSCVEKSLLSSPENPIVLLDQIESSRISKAVSPGLRTIGVLLPTTPLHQLLMKGLGFSLVATSGNRSEEPPAIDANSAHERLADIADCFLDHNRPIVRRLDDSVARVIDGKPVFFRLGRGYAPCPLPALERTDWPPILATGGHMKSAFAIHNGVQAALTQHIGDLDGPIARAEYDATARDLQRLFQFQPEAMATDLHPEYYSTLWAERQNLPLIRVQHHHAHAATVQAEHDLLDAECLALIWDGAGFGEDGTFWGGECLVTNPLGESARIASLRLIPLIGGEAAIREPARIAFGMLCDLLGPEETLRRHQLLDRLGLSQQKAQLLGQLWVRGSHVDWSSAVGRLFDGIASLVMSRSTVSYEGEAAIEFENIAVVENDRPYSWCVRAGDDRQCLGTPSIPRGDWRPMLSEILNDIDRGVAPEIIAGRFHVTLATWAASLSKDHAGLPVVLGGGCFQNRLLTEHAAALLRQSGANAYSASMIPPGDGGLAAGQLAVAMQRLQRGV